MESHTPLPAAQVNFGTQDPLIYQASGKSFELRKELVPQLMATLVPKMCMVGLCNEMGVSGDNSSL